MGYVHIHAPAATDRAISTGVCPDCKRRTRFAGVFTPWYGWDSTCLRCGRQWQDGEWCPLDFARGARAKSIEAAKRRYRRCVPTPEPIEEDVGSDNLKQGDEP